MSATWTEDDLILHLRSHGSVSVADLTYAFGGSPQSHTKRLEKMVASGKLDKRRLSGKKFQYHLKRASSGTPTMKNLRDQVIKLAYARPELRDDLLPLLKEAGCEKLPEGPMRDNCEKSKKDGVQPGKGKSKSKKKDDGKMPPELLEKFKAKKKASKMSLREKAIRLAYANPELRDDLLPLLKEAKSKQTWMVKPSVGKQDQTLDELDAACVRAGLKCDPHEGPGRSRRITVEGDPAMIKKVMSNGLWKTKVEKVAKKKDLPKELKKHQFTSEDNPNPKGNDRDGDGETGEEKPFTSKKALRAAIKMAYANPELRDRLLPLIKKAKSKHEKQFDDAKMLSKVDPALAKVMTTSGGSDDKIKVKTYSGSAASLKPSQTELIVGKSLGQALAMLDGKMPLTGDLGAIISKDNHIMDGHHRWAARILAKGKGASVTGMQADLLGKDLVKALNILTKGAFGRNQGNKGKGNIKEFTPANVKKALEGFLKKGIPGEFPWSPEDVKKTLEKSFGSVEEGVKTMSENAKNVVKSVPSWAVDRQEMPVINEKDLPKAKGILEKGELDWNKPYKQAYIDDSYESIDSKVKTWISKFRKGESANARDVARATGLPELGVEYALDRLVTKGVLKKDRNYYSKKASLGLRAQVKKASRTLTASERSALIKLASNLPTGNPERRAILASLDKLSKTTISESEYDSLKKGQRVEIEFGGAMSSGKATLEVGRTSYSKKYDVYTKTLYYIDKDTDKPITKNKVSFKLFKRLSYRGEKFDNPKISLAKGDMGVAIKSFRKV